jgi:hypothetical protein
MSTRWLVHYDPATGEIEQLSWVNVVTTFNNYDVAEVPPDHPMCMAPLSQWQYRVTGVTPRTDDIPLAVIGDATAEQQMARKPRWLQ